MISLPSSLPRCRAGLLALPLALLVSTPARLEAAEEKSGVVFDLGPIQRDANQPVPAPASLDPKYTAQGLDEAFRAVCKRLGWGVSRVAIDQKEFPFLVHGFLEGRCDYRELRDALQSLPGYAYSGSITSTSIRPNSTFVCLNMVPSSEYPRESAAAIRERLPSRLRALRPKP